jgi:hypothetical protein
LWLAKTGWWRSKVAKGGSFRSMTRIEIARILYAKYHVANPLIQGLLMARG